MNTASKYCRRAVCEFTRTTTSASSRNWVQKKFAFTSGTSTANYVLATIASNKTAGGGTRYDSISIDDIVFIYSAWATNIAFQGTDIPGFSKTNFGDYVATVEYVSDLYSLSPSDFSVTTEVSDVRETTVTFVEESGFTYNDRPARRAKIHILAEDGVTYKDYYVVVYALNDDPQYYNITTVASPATAGSVSLDPTGGTYVENSTVTLTATANTGYTFSQWSDGNTSNPRTVTVTADVTYTAQFVPQQFTITVSANPADGGTVEGGGTYDYNTTATLAATPNTGYEFVNWNDGNTNASRMVTVTENASYTANFQLRSYTVTATADDPAHGSVTGSNSYVYGTTATVEATPAEDYHFLRWSDLSTDNPYSFTVTDNKNLIAYFEMDEITYYTVTVVSSNTTMGTVSGSGPVREGRTTEISATPNTGYYFTQWNDGNTDNPRTVTVSEDITYTASFAPYTYTITALSADESMGTVDGGGQYDYGTIATLEALPETGFRFTQWDDQSTLNPRQVPVTGDATYTASFEQITFTVTATVNNAEYGSVEGSGVYNYGESVTLEATPDEGYHFVRWNDGETANPYIFNIYANKNVTAIFEADGAVITYYTVTVSPNDPAMGEVDGGGIYEENETATIEAIPATGYEFVAWNDDVTENPRNFTVTSDIEFVATFQPVSYTITVTANPVEGGEVDGGGVYQYGQTAHLTAEANPGYEFTGWNDDYPYATRDVLVTDNMSYTANFAQQTYTVNLIVRNAAYGSTTGSNTYHYGDQVTAEATANQGFQFDRWSDGSNTVSTDNPYIFIVTGNTDLYAEFVSVDINYYDVTVAASDPNMGGVSGAGHYPEGTTVSVEALPNYGYRFAHWQDGVTTNPRTFEIHENMSFTATFEADEFTLTVVANDAQMGTVEGSGTYAYGTVVEVSATARDGYHFVSWDGADAINNSKSETVTMNVTVTHNMTLTALFAEDEVIYYTITVLSNNETMGTVTGGGVYAAGEEIEISANPNHNHVFANWQDGNADNPRTIVVEGDRTFTAMFMYSGAVSTVPGGHIIAWCEAGRLFVKGVENHDVTVTDMMGRVIYRAEQCLYDSFNIDVPADGIYLVHADGAATRKVYVRR